MANQVGLNVYSINGIPQKGGQAIQIYFPTKQIMVQETFNFPVSNVNALVTHWPNPSQPAKGVEYGVGQGTTAVLATANNNGNSMFGATVVSVDKYAQKHHTAWLFPSEKPDIIDVQYIPEVVPEGANAAIGFKGRKYYAEETAANLKADSNSTTTFFWRSPLTAALGGTLGVPATTTDYFQTSGRQAGLVTTESTVQTAIPLDCTASDLVVVTSGSQPVDDDLVITLRVNGADSALVVTVPAGSSAGVFSDTSHTVDLVQGDLINYSVHNAAGTTGAVITSIALMLSGS